MTQIAYLAAMKNVFLESHHINNLYFGFGQFNYQLIKALHEADHPDIRIILHGKDLAFLKKEFGPESGYKKYFSWRRYPLLRIRESYDLWHSMNQNTRIEPHSTKMPYLLTVHNILQIDPANKKLVAKNEEFQNKLLRSQAITYISNHAKESTHEHYRVPNVPEYVIYNGNPVSEIVLSETFRPALRPARPYLFTIGEITGRKNFMSLVRMMPHLPDLDLIIAGKNTTGPAADIQAEIAKLGLSGRVHLPGKIGNEEKQYYYKNCEAFVFPSLREGFGLPVIEAMRFGKPAFISNLTALPEIGGDLAYYWEDFDPKYMADVFARGMQDYISRPDLPEKLVARALSFSWQNAAEKYLEVYRSML